MSVVHLSRILTSRVALVACWRVRDEVRDEVRDQALACMTRCVTSRGACPPPDPPLWAVTPSRILCVTDTTAATLRLPARGQHLVLLTPRGNPPRGVTNHKGSTTNREYVGHIGRAGHAQNTSIRMHVVQHLQG